MRQLPPVVAPSIEYPDLAGKQVVQQGRGRALNDDLRTVPGQPVGADRELARRDPVLRPIAQRDPPQVLVLEVLIEGVDIVLQGFAPLFVLAFRVVGEKIQRAAIGRPLDVRDARRVLCEALGFTARARQEIDLVTVSAAPSSRSR